MEEKELTYRDFEIGQKVRCTKFEDFYEQHLTVGKLYTITDLDFHFWDKICIKTNRNKTGMFIPIKFFTLSLNELRKKKLNRIV